jgi:hypothetical protein
VAASKEIDSLVTVGRTGTGPRSTCPVSTASTVDVITRLRVVGLIDIAKLRELRVTCVTPSEDVRFCRARA